MSGILLNGPALEPVSLAEAKAFLRVEHDDDDEVIAALIAGARIHVETQTRRALITQSWRLTRDAWPQTGRIAVRPGPLQSLEAARVHDGDGGPIELDVAGFFPDVAGSELVFAPWAMGGYSNHADDPGGPTNFGITIYDYRKYVKPDATAADVKAMSLDDAKAIYKSNYWDALACGALPAGIDYAVFDYGVNSGVGRAARVLQRLVGVVVDGVIGPVTIAAVRLCAPTALIASFCEERLQFLQSLKTWPVFGKGWSRRVAEVKQAALAMATQQDG
jgi:hypothetical protein